MCGGLWWSVVVCGGVQLEENKALRSELEQTANELLAQAKLRYTYPSSCLACVGWLRCGGGCVK